MNVLSLFDGMSCGRIALERAGINVDHYYSSEIDKYAIQVADKNYPQDTDKRLGSVIDLDTDYLKTLNIDLLIGGSPCQGFSMAGKMKGSSTKCGRDVTSLEDYLDLKRIGFEFDGQSYLFWEYVRILEAIKPKYFFLENVRITKKWLPMFNKAIGVEPVMINSALVSAQNRVRYYWTNIPNLSQPEDRGVLLKDILEDGIADIVIKGIGVPNPKSVVYKSNYVQWDINNLGHASQDQRAYYEDSKHGTLDTGASSKAKVLIVPEAAKKLITVNEDGDVIPNVESIGQANRIYSQDSIRPCLNSGWTPNVFDKPTYRKLTPVECERLQTVPDGYTDHVSNSQRYKMLGNGWTVDVVAHIFKGLI